MLGSTFTEYSMVLEQQAVQLTPMINQVSALPVDDTLEYYFIPMQHMSQYAPYYRPGKPFKNLKLLNYNQPAISLSFYYKHKYSIQRTPPHDEIILHLRNSRDEHLLKHTERIKGQVHERLNVIFIDPYYITRPVPNDNKFVDRELDTFPIQLRQGITTLYLRKS